MATWGGDTGALTIPEVKTTDDLGATIVVVSSDWLLDRVGDLPAQVAFDAADITEEWETTTTTVTSVDGATVIDPGAITGHRYSVSGHMTTLADLGTLRHVLDGDRVLLRGPWGEWDWVQLIGRIRAQRVQVYESTGEDRGYATSAETPWQVDVDFTLHVDTRWSATYVP